MAPGDVFRRTEMVQVFNKSDCSLVSSFGWTTDLEFIEYLAVLRLTENNLEILKVARLAWLVDGIIREEYWYGEGLGLIQWKADDGRMSYANERIPVGEQHNNTREVIDCL
jgi:hypothetical protein